MATKDHTVYNKAPVLVCTQDVRVGGVHYQPGDKARDPELLKTGAFKAA